VKECFGLLHTTVNKLNIFSSKGDEKTILPLGPSVMFFGTLICFILFSPPTIAAALLLLVSLVMMSLLPPWFLQLYSSNVRCGESPPPSRLGGLRRHLSPKQGDRLVA